jgi:hypothetical protein
VVLITMQLGVLRDSQRHIRSQDAKITALYNEAQNTARGVPATLDRLRPVATQARRAVRAVPPLLGVTQALAAAGIPLTRDARAVIAQVESSGLIDKAAAGTARIPEIVGIQKQTLQTQQRTLELQVQSLKAQRASLGIQVQTLAAMRQALVHIESIDRKTGGQVPPPAVRAP